MALIPHAQLDEIVREAVSLNLDDLSRRAEHLERESQARAERILADAGAERARILAGARQEGRAEGHAEGFEEGNTQGREAGRSEILAQLGPQIEALIESWTVTLAEFDSSRDSMLSEARTDIIRLALAMATKITHRVVEIDPGVAEAQLENMLSLLTRPTRLRVAVHPDDESTIRDAIPELLGRFDNATHAEVVVDDSLVRGSILAKRDTGGVLDASITTQLDRLIEEALPGFGGGES